jgi:hypothetical protein
MLKGDTVEVEKLMWILGDTAYDIPEWHDHLLAAGVPIVPYNPRDAYDLKDIESGDKARIEKHSEDVQIQAISLRQPV